MESRHFSPYRSLASAAFSAALFSHIATPNAYADVFYWDNDGATVGFGTATGTWAAPTTGSGTQGWSNDATGATIPVNVTTTNADTLNFGITTTGLATGPITVSGAVDANKLVFASGSGAITLSGGTIALGGVSPSITANKTGQIIGSAITLNANTSVVMGTTTVASISLNGAIGGTGNLTFTTPNVSSGGTAQTITLGAASGYSGTTLISTSNTNNNLTVRAGVVDSLPTSTVLTLDGGNGPSSTNRTVAYDLNGKNQTLAGLDNNKTRNATRLQRIINAPATAATLTITNTSPASPTFSGNINGTAISLVKTGTGTQTLGAANTYNGTTTINGGKLQGIVGGNCASSKVIINHASATLGVSITDMTKTWTCNELAPTAAGEIEFSFGAIIPSTSLSPLTITGLADFTVATPQVKVNVTTGLLPGTYPLMTWGSTVGSAPTTPNLTVPTMLPQTAASLAISGNTLNLVIVSTAVPVVKANNPNNLNLGTSWVGGTAPDANKLATWNSAVTSANTTVLGANIPWAGISILNPNGPVTINAGHTLTLGASAIQINMSAATSDLTLNCPLALGAAHYWDVVASRTLTLGGQVSGAFGIIKLGGGTAILSSSANSFTGDITVSAGTLRLGTSNVIPDGAAVGNISVASTLDLNGQSETLNGLSGAGMIDNLAAATTSTLTVGNNDQTSTYSGILKNTAGTLNLTKTGTGTLVLGGVNTLGGAVSVNGGTLAFNKTTPLDNVSGIAMSGGTTLRPDVANAVVSAPIAIGAANTKVRITGHSVDSSTNTTQIPFTLGGAISGAGGADFVGIESTNDYGRIDLNAACVYAGPTLITCSDELALPSTLGNQNIFVRLFVNNALPVTTVLTLDGGDGAPLASAPGRYCEFNLNGKNQTLAGLENEPGRTLRVQRVVNNSGTTSTLTINNVDPYTYAGQLGWVSGFGSVAYNNFNLTKNGIGTQILSGELRYDGSTTINSGTLTLGSTNANNDLSTVSIANTAAFLNLSFTGSDTVDKLFIGTTQKLAGTYGSIGSGAQFEISQITGTGTLIVATGPGYASWQSANSTAQAANLDHDNDGVFNGIEHFLGGSTITTGFTALPGVTNTAGTLSVTWTRAASYTGSYGPDFVVETSATLTGPWATEPNPGPTITFPTANEVKYTFPTPLGTKNFVRLKATP